MSGPSALPIIGNLHQLGALPHRTLQRMAEKHGPIMSLKLGSLDFVVASSSEVTKQFLKTHDLNFSNRASSTASKHLLYNGRDILSAPHGEFWRDMRKVSVMELLNSKRIDSFGKVMEEEAVAMVRSMWEKSEEGRVGVNVSESVASYVSNTTWRMLTGSTNSNLRSGGMTFGEMVTEVTYLLGPVNIGEFFPFLEWLDLHGLRQRMKNVHQLIDAVFSKILDDRAERKRRSGAEESERHKDLVDALVDMEIGAADKRAIIFVS